MVPGEEDFEMSINFLSYFVMEDNVVLHLKKNLNPLHQKSLVEIGSVVLERAIFRYCQYSFDISLLSLLAKERDA